MAKFLKFKKNHDLEEFGFVAGAALSIPFLIICGFVISLLVKSVF